MTPSDWIDKLQLRENARKLKRVMVGRGIRTAVAVCWSDHHEQETYVDLKITKNNGALVLKCRDKKCPVHYTLNERV